MTVNPYHMCKFQLFQPFASPFINLHKEAQPVPFATLSKKWPCSHLNNPFQIPTIASSIHAWMR